MLWTFHKIIAGCEQGEVEAWGTFLIDYSPIALTLTEIYMPGRTDPASLWCDTLVSLCSEDFKPLRTFAKHSEQEFMLDLRSFLFEKGLAQVDPGKDSTGFAEPTEERVRALVRGLPLLHQEALFLKLAGYSDATLEQIFRITPAVAQKSFERLKPDYSAVLGNSKDACLWPAAWLKLGCTLRDQRTEACPTLRQFIRIQDGQMGWYDKEPAEKHLAECLPCLEGWTALKEVAYWRHSAKPVSGERVDGLLARLPVHKQSEKTKSLLKKVLG